LGLPGNTMFQKKTQKTTNDEDNMGIRGWKADVPKNTVELNSEIQDRSATRYRQKLLIGKKDYITKVVQASNF
jgi:hypothetical protein